MQAAVIDNINMAVLAVVIVDSANNIGSAVAACTLSDPGSQEPRGMGISRMVAEARIMGRMTGQAVTRHINGMTGCCTV